jgi:AraC-like DNA-binding protein
MARQVLINANPATTRVSDVAAQYGFSDHSRFARQYRQQFGELPSETLRANCPILL